MERLLISDRVLREEQHATVILQAKESNWGWSTPAGIIRRLRRLELLVGGLNQKPSSLSVLEIGCGTGTFTGDISKFYPNVVGVDISNLLLQVSRSKYPHVDFRKMDIHQLEFQDNVFDMVLGCSVLHHLELKVALAEIRRVLKPGGKFKCSEPNLLNPQIYLQKKWGWLKQRMGDSPDETAFTSGEMRKALGRLKFVNVEVLPYEFLHPGTPQMVISLLVRVEAVIEKTLLRHIGGSLRISAQKPG